MIASFTLDWLCAVTRCADLLWPFNKISTYFGDERNGETENTKVRTLWELKKLMAMVIWILNLKEGEMSNESHNFQVTWLREHTWLRYENQAMFCHLCHLGKKENPFSSDKGCSNSKTTTLTRHLSSREHQDATMEAQFYHWKKNCPPIVPVCPLPKALKG